MSSKIIRNYISLIIEQTDAETEFVMADEPEEEKSNLTFGDFKNFLKAENLSTSGKKVFKYIYKSGFGAALGGFLNISNITEELIENMSGDYIEKKLAPKLRKLSPYKIILSFYGINEEKGLKPFKIPDEFSKIAEDKIEEEFIVYLTKRVNRESDNALVPNDYTLKEWNVWLNKNYKTKMIKV